MRNAPLDEPEFRRWRKAAERPLEIATQAADGPAYNWACFLAEQAGQLSVKALLHGVGRSARGHDLVALGNAVRVALPEAWPAALDEPCIRLSRHYITSRYPDAVPGGVPEDHYSPADATQAVSDARALIAAVDAAWKALSE